MELWHCQNNTMTVKQNSFNRDRIQHHVLYDVSTVLYDRYDYNEEKMETLLNWGGKLKETMNNK
jgi:hypothetical protein